MNTNEKNALLNLRRLPGRLLAVEAAVVLGFAEHDLPILVSAGLLSPLGRPARNAPKYFAASQVEAFSRDVAWLARATDAVAAHWRQKNGSAQPEPLAMSRRPVLVKAA